MQYYCLTTGRGKNVGGAIHLIGILLISYKLSETLIFKRMDKRQQPSRLARKRMSEDIETDDQDEMDDLQARLDRILGSDSGSEYALLRSKKASKTYYVFSGDVQNVCYLSYQEFRLTAKIKFRGFLL